MCGIIGFTGRKQEEVLRQMNAIQKHRGPDEEGFFTCEDANVHFGMSRLSIVDLMGGQQPMEIDNGDLWIVSNGEIFNAPDLRQQLEAKGRKFHTNHSDTEVLLHMYAVFGKAMLSQLNGMFAFTIYDRKQKKLFCARDPFGIKPFYYSMQKDRFSFASELKSLLLLPWLEKTIDFQAIYHFFSFQCLPAPFSAFRNILKLPAAHWLEYHLQTRHCCIERYWAPYFGNQLPCQTKEIPAYILNELQGAVKRWSWSDVPVACSLSGGLDSSIITALLAQIDQTPLQTFSLGFADATDLDERPLALQVATRWQTNHTEIEIQAQDLLEEIDPMIAHLDEPYAGGLPSWFVFKEMAKVVKVGMTGTGGDELFGNYGKWSIWEHPLDTIRGIQRYWKNGSGVRRGIQNWHGSLYHPMYLTDERKRNHLFKKEFLEAIQDSSAWIENLWDRNNNARENIVRIDLQQQLSEEFLLMTDRFSMAHSLEARTPFLDKEFVEKMLLIPATYRSQRRNLKVLLKTAASSLLPTDLLSAPKKGFVLPMKQWLSGKLLQELEFVSSPKFLQQQGLFQENLWQSWLNPNLDVRINRTNQRWTWFLFQKWWIHTQKTCS